MYKITLADGTVLDSLQLNGNNFISTQKIEKSVFEGNLSPVTISDGESESVHDNMNLVQLLESDVQTWFILRDYSEDELREMKMQSDIAYLAMMTGVEL